VGHRKPGLTTGNVKGTQIGNPEPVREGKPRLGVVFPLRVRNWEEQQSAENDKGGDFLF